MRIKDLLSESTINVLSKAQNKSEVIDEAVNLLFKNDILTDKDAFAKLFGTEKSNLQLVLVMV